MVKTALILFEYSGTFLSRYKKLGYQVVVVDLELGLDIMEFDYKQYENVEVIIAHPPCTEFAGSGARWWKDKPGLFLENAINLVKRTLEIIDYHKPKFWFIENPVGRIAECVPELRNYHKVMFDPCDFGGYGDYSDAYTKKTCLWGCFIMPPYKRIEPVLGSKIHKLSGNDKKGRSLTPKGFANAFVIYNNSLKINQL